jgi:hypothetical protein
LKRSQLELEKSRQLCPTYELAGEAARKAVAAYPFHQVRSSTILPLLLPILLILPIYPLGYSRLFPVVPGFRLVIFKIAVALPIYSISPFLKGKARKTGTISHLF